MTDHLPTIFERWGVNPDLAARFKFIPRLSNWRDHSEKVQNGLQAVYGHYRNYLQTLDGCFVL